MNVTRPRKTRRSNRKNGRGHAIAGQLELQFPLSALDARTLKHIRCKARQLCLRSPFTPSDRNDIEQELALDLMLRAAKFNSTKGRWNTFFSRVVRNKISHLIEARLAKGRDYRLEVCSANEVVVNDAGEMVERLCVLEDTGKTPSYEDKAHDLALDLACVINALPEHLQSLCLALRQDTNLAEIARNRGISRDALYPLLKEIRGHFTAAGLQTYLRNNGCRDP